MLPQLNSLRQHEEPTRNHVPIKKNQKSWESQGPMSNTPQRDPPVKWSKKVSQKMLLPEIFATIKDLEGCGVSHHHKRSESKLRLFFKTNRLPLVLVSGACGSQKKTGTETKFATPWWPQAGPMPHPSCVPWRSNPNRWAPHWKGLQQPCIRVSDPPPRSYEFWTLNKKSPRERPFVSKGNELMATISNHVHTDFFWQGQK